MRGAMIEALVVGTAVALVVLGVLAALVFAAGVAGMLG